MLVRRLNLAMKILSIRHIQSERRERGQLNLDKFKLGQIHQKNELELKNKRGP